MALATPSSVPTPSLLSALRNTSLACGAMRRIEPGDEQPVPGLDVQVAVSVVVEVVDVAQRMSATRRPRRARARGRRRRGTSRGWAASGSASPVSTTATVIPAPPSGSGDGSGGSAAGAGSGSPSGQPIRRCSPVTRWFGATAPGCCDPSSTASSATLTPWAGSRSRMSRPAKPSTAGPSVPFVDPSAGRVSRNVPLLRRAPKRSSRERTPDSASPRTSSWLATKNALSPSRAKPCSWWSST